MGWCLTFSLKWIRRGRTADFNARNGALDNTAEGNEPEVKEDSHSEVTCIRRHDKRIDKERRDYSDGDENYLPRCQTQRRWTSQERPLQDRIVIRVTSADGSQFNWNDADDAVDVNRRLQISSNSITRASLAGTVISLSMQMRQIMQMIHLLSVKFDFLVNLNRLSSQPTVIEVTV